jgi:hypothetical protein
MVMITNMPVAHNYFFCNYGYGLSDVSPSPSGRFSDLCEKSHKAENLKDRNSDIKDSVDFFKRLAASAGLMSAFSMRNGRN